MDRAVDVTLRVPPDVDRVLRKLAGPGARSMLVASYLEMGMATPTWHAGLRGAAFDRSQGRLARLRATLPAKTEAFLGLLLVEPRKGGTEVFWRSAAI